MAAAGTVLAAVTPEFDAGAGGVGSFDAVFDLRIASGNEGLYLAHSSTLSIWEVGVRSGAATVATLRSVAVVPVKNERQILGVTWEVNDFRLFANGEEEASDTTGAAPMEIHTTLRIGRLTGAGINEGNMSIAHVLSYNHRLSAGEMLIQSDQMRAWMG